LTESVFFQNANFFQTTCGIGKEKNGLAVALHAGVMHSGPSFFALFTKADTR
jgi:hypothetical protein